LAAFIADQFGSPEPEAATTAAQPTVTTSTSILELLNERPGGFGIVGNSWDIGPYDPYDIQDIQ